MKTLDEQTNGLRLRHLVDIAAALLASAPPVRWNRANRIRRRDFLGFYWDHRENPPAGTLHGLLLDAYPLIAEVPSYVFGALGPAACAWEREVHESFVAPADKALAQTIRDALTPESPPFDLEQLKTAASALVAVDLDPVEVLQAALKKANAPKPMRYRGAITGRTPGKEENQANAPEPVEPLCPICGKRHPLGDPDAAGKELEAVARKLGRPHLMKIRHRGGRTTEHNLSNAELQLVQGYIANNRLAVLESFARMLCERDAL
jgi:hypothetical protein